MDDRTWIHAIRRGDSEAFADLYGCHRERVFRYACALSGSRNDAEDLLQEAFLGLLRNIEAVDETRPLLPYLLRSVRNRHVDRLRSFEERRRPLVADAPHTAREESANRVERDERVHRVTSALGELPAAQAEVVRLRIYGGLDYESIAAELAVPAATARSRYRSALEKLRRLLGRSVEDV